MLAQYQATAPEATAVAILVPLMRNRVVFTV